jgi:branched-subunit amino acid aminotransferase/4-amino-4-deoxychorismate lyase
MARVGGGVEALVEIGLIETIRARNGRVPWLGRHLGRLYGAIAALGLSDPADDVGDLVRAAGGPGDRVVRLEVRGGHAELTTRQVNTDRAPAVIVSDVLHEPYPYKTTRREPFGRALAGARRRGMDDALLLTAAGFVAEGTAWSLFWWNGTGGGGGGLCTPAAELGILPGLGRRRVMELTEVREEQVPVSALAGRSLFLVNAVRGIVEIGSLQGVPVPGDPRTAELSSVFWPD